MNKLMNPKKVKEENKGRESRLTKMVGNINKETMLLISAHISIKNTMPKVCATIAITILGEPSCQQTACTQTDPNLQKVGAHNATSMIIFKNTKVKNQNENR